MYEKLAITKYIAKNTNIIFARWVYKDKLKKT